MLHTPGHTPESTCYAVFVEDAPGRALAVFSGDTLFIGETGRTDLTEPKKTGEHAGQLYVAGAGIGALSWLAFATAKKPIGVTTAFESTAAGLAQNIAPQAMHVNAYLAKRDEAPTIDWEWMLAAGITVGKAHDQRHEHVRELAESDRKIARWMEAFESGTLDVNDGKDRLRVPPGEAKRARRDPQKGPALRKGPAAPLQGRGHRAVPGVAEGRLPLGRHRDE